jgi:hypothetical protein
MRIVLLLLVTSISAFSQRVSFGLKAGAPATELIDAQPGAFFNYSSVTNRYLVGPTVEAKLPLGLAVEFDAIYRHFRTNSSGCRVNVCAGTDTPPEMTGSCRYLRSTGSTCRLCVHTWISVLPGT